MEIRINESSDTESAKDNKSAHTFIEGDFKMYFQEKHKSNKE